MVLFWFLLFFFLKVKMSDIVNSPNPSPVSNISEEEHDNLGDAIPIDLEEAHRHYLESQRIQSPTLSDMCSGTVYRASPTWTSGRGFGSPRSPPSSRGSSSSSRRDSRFAPYQVSVDGQYGYTLPPGISECDTPSPVVTNCGSCAYCRRHVIRFLHQAEKVFQFANLPRRQWGARIPTYLTHNAAAWHRDNYTNSVVPWPVFCSQFVRSFMTFE